MALNSQGLQSELSQVSITFVCNEGTSSSTGAHVVWCVLHSMRILWPSVHQLDSSSGGGRRSALSCVPADEEVIFQLQTSGDPKALGRQQIVKQCLAQQV